MVYVTRRLHFNAAHRMHNPAWDDGQNREVFGKCNNPNGHGHNYELEITVCGEPHPDTGYVMDLHRLKQVVDATVVEKLDHRHLNHDVDFMQGILPSSENLAMAIWRELEPVLKPAQLYSVRLFETPRNFVEYRGT